MVRYLMDENVPHAIGDQLLRREPAIEVSSVGDDASPPIGTSDPAILIWIEQHEAYLVSRNRRTMPSHLADHLAAGHHVPGIFLIKRDHSLGEVIDDQRRGQFSVKTGRAFLRAINALDFSTTPNSDSWLVRTRRVLLLTELLGRIELPPEEEIPGEKAVADGAVTEWTIPNTALTIAVVEVGPRKDTIVCGEIRAGPLPHGVGDFSIHRFQLLKQHGSQVI